MFGTWPPPFPTVGPLLLILGNDATEGHNTLKSKLVNSPRLPRYLPAFALRLFPSNFRFISNPQTSSQNKTHLLAGPYKIRSKNPECHCAAMAVGHKADVCARPPPKDLRSRVMGFEGFGF